MNDTLERFINKSISYHEVDIIKLAKLKRIKFLWELCLQEIFIIRQRYHNLLHLEFYNVYLLQCDNIQQQQVLDLQLILLQQIKSSEYKLHQYIPSSFVLQSGRRKVLQQDIYV
ncbi:hypothetical protein pb186bvf_020500, partial [Paramecium bursaria]